MPRTLAPGQRAELYVCDVLTGDLSLRLSSDTLLFEAPNWTPDGGSLVVNGDGRLFRLGVTSGELEAIPMPGVDPINNDHVISPDGLTAYVSSDDGHIYAVPMDGQGGVRRITTDKGAGFRHYLHGASPDGSTLAYVGMEILTADSVRTNVFLIDVETQAERQLTDDDHPDDGAEFSPDGSWVYFNSERASTEPGHAQLFRVPADGGEPEQLTFDERVNWFPHPDPDGRRIAYVSFPPGTLGHPADLEVIVRVLEDDGTVRDLTALFGGQGTMNVPSWSPDGRRLAFVAYPLG
ncbi:TolB family protein [Actinotalea sp.]|uniref:TolB family protein n=1 Tax=Actinotalea sp. TaxID=1872145 RepID=UPI003564E4FC